MHNDIKYWKDSFPSNHKPRKAQIDAINFALNQFFNNGKRFVVLQSPTGTGKSHIAVTLANYFHKMNSNHKSYILTTQLILQDQYKRQFPLCANISARGNYTCNTFTDSTCAQMKWLHKYSEVPYCERCVYQTAKHEFVKNYCSVTNTAFFMSNLQYNQQLIQNRRLMVVDQCHNLQQDIIRYKSLELDFYMLKTEYGYKQTDWVKEGQNPMNWVKNVFAVWLQDKKNSYQETMANSKLNFAKSKMVDISKKYDFLDKLLCQLNRTMAVFSTSRWVVQAKDKQRIVKITPIYAYDFSQEMLFQSANHILLMSGTILDKDIYCDNLGIKKSECAFLSLDSSFPIQNRPVFLIDSGSMSKKNIDASIGTVINNIQKILEIHKGQKGIIHVSSHKLALLISQKLKTNRVIIAQDFGNRNNMLQHHYGTSDDSVLISPSLMQGLDLKDDLSRFQIIAKIPFPNLGDKYIATKKQKIKDWYSYQTVKAIVQSYGRSVRSEDDYASTYILDSDFFWVMRYNINMFPKFFKQAIVYGEV